jgi:hypothetical protein
VNGATVRHSPLAQRLALVVLFAGFGSLMIAAGWLLWGDLGSANAATILLTGCAGVGFSLRAWRVGVVADSDGVRVVAMASTRWYPWSAIERAVAIRVRSVAWSRCVVVLMLRDSSQTAMRLVMLPLVRNEQAGAERLAAVISSLQPADPEEEDRR